VVTITADCQTRSLRDVAWSHAVQVIGVARTCSLVLIVLDCAKPMIHKRIIEVLKPEITVQIWVRARDVDD
jgi:ribosome-interacting GTPase 1